MSAETTQNKAIVRRLFEDVWSRGNLGVAAEILAQPQGVQDYVRAFRSAFPDVQHTVVGMIAEADAVVVCWTAKATHTGQWHSLGPTGADVSWSGVTVAHVVNGKIVEHQTAWDTLGLLEQIGAVPRIRKADGSRL